MQITLTKEQVKEAFGELRFMGADNCYRYDKDSKKKTEEVEALKLHLGSMKLGNSVDAWKPPNQYFTGACGSNRRRIYRIGARTWQNGHLCGNYSGYHVSVGWCDRSVAACDGDVFCGGGTGKMDDGTSGDLS